ncbi:MAG: hypothetical protein HIU92_21525 [Proteobacteria bacterium]|nr:hypothetical protein [Pseudomonadota bacterium]
MTPDDIRASHVQVAASKDQILGVAQLDKLFRIKRWLCALDFTVETWRIVPSFRVLQLHGHSTYEPQRLSDPNA